MREIEQERLVRQAWPAVPARAMAAVVDAEGNDHDDPLDRAELAVTASDR